MVVTQHPEWARVVRALRDWGQSGAYRHVAPGFNYRMEAIQGAVLGVKLRHLDTWTAARRANAARFDAALAGSSVQAPPVMPWARHVYHLYAVRARQRSSVEAALRQWGVETRVHYRIPIHLQEACAYLGHGPGDFPQAERAAREVLSIPVHAELSDGQVCVIADALGSLNRAPAAVATGASA